MGFSVAKMLHFGESGIKVEMCSVTPRNMLTFTFLEKHVSLNYNPCWCQNVCSLNIYQPGVASKAEHRHLEAFFFFFFSKVLCPKGNAVKALQTASELRRGARNAFSSNTSNRRRRKIRKKKYQPTKCAA